MKVLVCGSRNWQDGALIEERLSRISHLFIITGTKRREDRVKERRPQVGADCIAHDIAIRDGIPHVVIEADWDRFGKAAGPIRNLAMLDLEPDLVLAFWDGKSRGTDSTIKEARRRGIPVEITLAGQP